VTCKLSGVRIAGIASAVPADVRTLVETAAAAGVSEKDALAMAKMHGVQRRHVAPEGMCTSDMAYRAAVQLLDDLGWERGSIDAIVVVTQTPDYDLPATACCLQARLGLASTCAAFDVALGCSGYIYGLWLCSGLIASNSLRRVLLLAGDTSSWLCSPLDRSTAFLFGDAATATALEREEEAPPMVFVLGTDGAGKDSLILPGGAYRNRVTLTSLERRAAADGAVRGPLDLYMNGAEVFTFTLERVPNLVHELLSASGWTQDAVDAFVPHQANLFILQHLFKKMKIAPEKLKLSLDEFGNTSSASIPLTISRRLAERVRTAPTRLVLAGFGVGWSWGAAALTCGPAVMSEIVYMDGARPQTGSQIQP
jgi:3-oxoacyl-[acyl-carrier-protein] synthase-3